MRLKSAFHSQAHCKKFRKEANSRATLLNVQSAVKSMRLEHRGVCRDTEVSTPPALAIGNMSRHLLEISPDAAEEAQPALVAEAQAPSDSVHAPVSQTVASCRAKVPLFPSPMKRRHDKVHSGEEAGPPKKKRAPRRCRNCGNTCEHESNFRKCRVTHGNIGSSDHKDPQEARATPFDFLVKGHPREKGQRMPRQRGPPRGGQWSL